MPRLIRYAAQALLYGLFALAIGYCSSAPSYRELAPDQALLRLSFTHPGRIVAECRERTPEELAKLPANMRAPSVCPRERSPVVVRLVLDGRELYHESFAPAGLARDGAASAYRRLAIAAGVHRVQVQFNDDVRVKGFNYERETTLTAAPGQVVLVDFAPERGGVIIR